MSNAITATATATATAAFLPMVNKAGKISATAEKTAHVLNSMARAGLESAAVHGKGAIKAQALRHVLADARDVSAMMSDTRPDFGLILGQLVAEFGVTLFNRATMRGRAGVGAFLRALSLDAELRVSGAETVKAQNRAIEHLKSVQALDDAYQNAVTRFEAARVADQLANAAPMTDTITAPMTDTMADTAPEAKAKAKGKKQAA